MTRGVVLLWGLLLAAPSAWAQRIEVLRIDASDVSPTPLRVRVVLPEGYRRTARPGYPVLYVNDGQDMEAVGLRESVARLQRDGTIRPLIVVAIDMPPDRMSAYGFSDRAAGKASIAPTRYGEVGGKAHAYSQWLTHALVPHIDGHYNTRADAASRSLLGWSLGAANAFSVGWQYPEVFGRIGAFSPSLWLSTRREDAGAVQASRIAHAMVDGSS